MIIHIEIGFHPKCSKFEERFKRCFNSFLYYSDLISKMIGRSFLHQNCFEFSWFFFLCRLHLLQFTDRYVMQHFPLPFCFVKYRKKLYVYETLYEVLLHLEIWREKKRIFVRGSTRHSFKQWVVCLGIYRIFEKNKKGFEFRHKIVFVSSVSNNPFKKGRNVTKNFEGWISTEKKSIEK
jgi:hypothetical protein